MCKASGRREDTPTMTLFPCKTAVYWQLCIAFCHRGDTWKMDFCFICCFVFFPEIAKSQLIQLINCCIFRKCKKGRRGKASCPLSSYASDCLHCKHTKIHAWKKGKFKSQKEEEKKWDTMTPIYLHTTQQYPAVPAIDFSGTESPCWRAAAVSA